MRRRRGLLTGLLAGAGLMVVPAVAGAATIGESFSPPSIPQTGTTTLTFTIDNPGGFLHTARFDDTLPAGLQVAGSPTTTCAAGLPTSGGPSDIAFTDLALTETNCTVSATVRGVQAGHWDDPVSNATIDMNPARPTPRSTSSHRRQSPPPSGRRSSASTVPRSSHSRSPIRTRRSP